MINDRDTYIAKCTHYRKRSLVYKVDGKVVFNGGNEQFEGVNAAKRYVRSNNLKSYTAN